MSPNADDQRRAPHGLIEHPSTLEDLSGGLVWPLIVRAPAMALSPARLVLGAIGCFVLALWTSVFSLMFENDSSALRVSLRELVYDILDGALAINPGAIVETILTNLGLMILWISDQPLKASVLIVPSILIASIAVHAIARSAAIEHATGRQTDTVDALSQALRSVRQIALASLGPIVPVAILALLILAIGFTLGIPILDLFGGLLYGLALFFSLLAVIISTLHTLCLPMTVSALAIEGTDGFDAVQRSFAYAASRPLRYALYVLLALALTSICLSIGAAITGGAVTLADVLASQATNDAGRRLLEQGAAQDELGATAPAARSIVEFWRALLMLLLSGYALSLVACLSSMLYLCMRRVCDGQDTAEIWDPAD